MRRAVRLSGVLVALAVVACNGPTMVDVPPSSSAAERACAAKVDDGPEMREVRAISAGRLEYEYLYLPQIQQVKRDAMTRCLQVNGVMPKGGVERPR